MGVGGYLYQIIDGEERIVSFYSRSTTKAERKWDTRDLEVLAIIAALEHYRPVISINIDCYFYFTTLLPSRADNQTRDEPVV